MSPEKLNLIEAFLDENAAEADLRSIRELIDADADFRSELLLAIRTRGLCAISRTAAQDFADRVISHCDDLQNAPLADRVLRVIRQPERSFWRKNRLALAAAATVAIFATAGFLLLPYVAFRHAVVAKVSEQSEEGFVVRGGEKIALLKDMEIRAEDLIYVEDRGTAEITYTDGTDMRFDPLSYAQFKQEGVAKRVLLYSGGIHLDVAPQPEGPLVVITEHMRSVVRGTRFDINTSGVLTQINVREGKVAVSPARQSGETMVSAGEFLTIDPKAKTTRGTIGMPIFASPLLTKDSTPTKRIPISVPFGQSLKLYLVVTNGGDNNRYDHAVWIRPRLTGPAGEWLLSDHPWIQGKAGSNFSPMRNASSYGGPPKINGVLLKDCITTHATSVIEYDIPPGYDHFEAEGGLLDSGVNQPDSSPSVTFEVYTELPAEKLNSLLIRRNFY